MVKKGLCEERNIRAWDKGKWRNWGTIKKIEGDNVEIYLGTQPEGYKTRIENLPDIKKWISEGMLKITARHR